jgi:hypothetical protein
VIIPRSCRATLLAFVFAATTSHAQDAELARGAELLAPFKKDLQQALKSGLAEGPASHKLRNPDNTAPDWVSPIMQTFLDDPSSREPLAVGLADNRWGYVEPIMLQPLCLTCHGSELAPGVAEQISELYPEDHAIGFEAGDLRGVFWLEFPGEMQ